MRQSPRPAFTIVELLVVVAILGVLIAILLPAVGKVRDQAKVTESESNLRQLGAAHVSYASTWNERQFSLVPDDLASYAIDRDDEYNDACITHDPGPRAAVLGYQCKKTIRNPDGSESVRRRSELPPIQLGYGAFPGGEQFMNLLPLHPGFPKNYVLLQPIAFEPAWGDPEIDIDRMGYFRVPNARQFSQYLTGRFYDDVFYAPKDEMVNDLRADVRDHANEFTPMQTMRDNYAWSTADFCYSSYSLSPAALFAPEVMRNSEAGGWQNPWELNAGLRAPSMSQAHYPGLKTHMLEHHWLQGSRPSTPCNPKVTEPRMRPYRDCQPYFFNHAWESTPMVLFYDGHVGPVGHRRTERDDGQAKMQSGYGLWSRDTPFGDDGYFIGRGYDQAATSFHILTTDGILGRDITSGG